MSRRVVVRWMLAGSLLLGAAACERKPVENAYFPLEAGRTWSYTLTPESLADDEQTLALSVTSIGPEEVQGQRVTRQKIDLNGDTHFLFVGVDDKGVFRFATQSPGEAAPSVDAERDYFLAKPLTVGNTWKGTGAPTFLDVAEAPVPIQSTVESTTETVRVAAGEFTNCVKINVTGSVAISSDEDDPDPAATAQQGQEDDGRDDADAEGEEDENYDLDKGTFSLHEQTWYAAGVGVVKSVITESFESEFGEQKARVTTELQSFTR